MNADEILTAVTTHGESLLREDCENGCGAKTPQHPSENPLPSCTGLCWDRVLKGQTRRGEEVECCGGENEAPLLPSESLLPGSKKVCSGRVLEKLAKREDEIEGCE